MMQMDASDSAYKPNGDYHLMSTYGWHTPVEDLQFGNGTAYPYSDYGTPAVKSEYDDCGGGGSGSGSGGGDGGGVNGGVNGAGAVSGTGSCSSSGLEQDVVVELKKGICNTCILQARGVLRVVVTTHAQGRREGKAT